MRELYQFRDPDWEKDWLRTVVECSFALEGTVNFVVWHFLTKSSLLIKDTKAPKSVMDEGSDVATSLINTAGEGTGITHSGARESMIGRDIVSLNSKLPTPAPCTFGRATTAALRRPEEVAALLGAASASLDCDDV